MSVDISVVAARKSRARKVSWPTGRVAVVVYAYCSDNCGQDTTVDAMNKFNSALHRTIVTQANVITLQGRSKRSGWSGHGRTNNRAGNLFYFFLLNFLLSFFGRNNNRAGNLFNIIFETETTQRQNVHSDDSISGRFRPSHIILLRAGSHHHSMGGKGHQVHEFFGLYSDPQCDAGSYMCYSDWTYLWKNFADSATMEVTTWVDRERVLLSAYRS